MADEPKVDVQVETVNSFGVCEVPGMKGVGGLSFDGPYFHLSNPPAGQYFMTAEGAVNLASWLIFVADPDGKRWPMVLQAIRQQYGEKANG